MPAHRRHVGAPAPVHAFAATSAVTKQCDGCMASHARSASRRGATAEDVADALGVAILMNGGPGTVHAPRVFEAFRECNEQ